MSAFPLGSALGAYMGTSLAASQLLMSAAGGTPAVPVSPKNAVAPAAGHLAFLPRFPYLQEYAVTVGQPSPFFPHFAAAMADPGLFYNALNGVYDVKDNAEALAAWRHLAQTGGGFLPYDTHAANMATSFTYPPYSGLDLNGARRKNATRETTSTLKAWLYEHRKNPYPTKGEKIMLAILTKMTLTQVSTWFANARRRLKKENKMTWSPRNRTSDGSVDGDESKNDEAGDGDDVSIDLSDFDDYQAEDKDGMLAEPEDTVIQSEALSRKCSVGDIADGDEERTKTEASEKSPVKDNDAKPKIWSIADVAASKPAGSYHSIPTPSGRHRPYPAPASFRPWFDAAAYRQFAAVHPFASPLLPTARQSLAPGLRIPHVGHQASAPATKTSPVATSVGSADQPSSSSSALPSDYKKHPSNKESVKLKV